MILFSEVLSIFNAHDVQKDEFFFYLADVFTIGVQYGGRTQLCDMLQSISSESFLNQLRALKSYADSKGVLLYQYDSSSLRNTSIDFNNNARQWTYQYCTEFGWFQIPNTEHPMRSDYIDTPFWFEYCKRIFGESVQSPNIEYTNGYTGGLEITGDNIFFVNGIEDPWQWAGMREIYNPSIQGNMVARLVNCTDCGHCVDLGTPSPNDPQALIEVREEILTQIQTWLAQDTLKRLRQSRPENLFLNA
jgi:hypothetical protein